MKLPHWQWSRPFLDSVFIPFSKGMSLAAPYIVQATIIIYIAGLDLEPESAKRNCPGIMIIIWIVIRMPTGAWPSPRFDYLLGTRVISSADLQEQNPLGLSLPAPISKKLNRWAEQYFPVKWADASSKMTKKYCKKYGNEAVKYAGYGL